MRTPTMIGALRLGILCIAVMSAPTALSDDFSLEQVLMMLYGDDGTMNKNISRISDADNAIWRSVSGQMTAELTSKQTAFGTSPGEIAVFQVNDDGMVTEFISEEIPFTDRSGMALVERQGPTPLLTVGFDLLTLELNRGGTILSSDADPDRMYTWEIIDDDFPLIDPEDIGNFVIAWEDLSPAGGDFQDWTFEIGGVSPAIARVAEPITLALITLGLAGLGFTRRRGVRA